ncbi:MAG: glycosyltransferase family protein [Clostridia bacterium]|nr:glycosyltransferase family protein [Clostridia bacterium]
MILAIIQARMGSSRLPGKVLIELLGKTVLWHVVNRVKQSNLVDKVLVATSTNEKDDLIVQECKRYNINCFTGNENDVLDRFYNAAVKYSLRENDSVVRITADCPLIDPKVIDNVISVYLNNKCDYASNINPPTFPDGLDIEIFKFSALEKSYREARLTSEREHVTLYVRNHPELFSTVNFEYEKDISNLRWTLDEKEDLDVILKIYRNLYLENNIFFLGDILDLLEKVPEISKGNIMFKRNEGLEKSLKNDKAI